MNRRRRLHCSFCGKSEAEVLKLVAGPRAYICDKCVAIASEIVNHQSDDNQSPGVRPSVWRRLLTRARDLIGGGAARRTGSLSVQG